jgi:hypothetical protein
LVENTNKRESPSLAVVFEPPFKRIYKLLKIDKEQKVVGFYIYAEAE